ncbi:MAG: hypothetical protein WDZ91_15670 [Paenibacillaceae bacterium]
MILYQVAMRMEERDRLKQSIRENDGDVSCLIDDKVEIEQYMLTQASKWMEEEQTYMWSGVE